MLYNFDRAFLLSLGFNLINKIEFACVGHIKVHAIGLQEAEEDEWLMLHIGYSQLICFLFPLGPAVLNDLIMFDYQPPPPSPSPSPSPSSSPSSSSTAIGGSSSSTQLSKAVKRSIFLFYKECVQRHLFARLYIRSQLLPLPLQVQVQTQTASTKDHHHHHHHQQQQQQQQQNPHIKSATRLYPEAEEGGLIFVSKNPTFTLRIDSLYEAFPDARIVVLVRDPQESVPSMVSYISLVWSAFSSPLERYPAASDLVGFCIAHYLFPAERLVAERISDRQWAFVSYSKLKNNLEESVLQLLERFDVICSSNSSSNSSRKRRRAYVVAALDLQRQQLKSDAFVSPHVHSLEACCNGLCKGDLRRLLATVYQTYPDMFATNEQSN